MVTGNGELERRLHDLERGDHVCMVYDNQAEQMAAAIPFILHGLTARECCIYIADDRSVEGVLAALAGRGINVARERDRGALQILTERESYLKYGQFDPSEMVDTLSRATEDAVRRGFEGFRVTGEMTWALGDETGCDRLIEYEALLNRFFPGSKATAICQYNRQRFSPTIIRDVLRTHPHVVLGNNLCTNLYYEPPEFLLQGGNEAERVEWMVRQLRRNEEAFAEIRRANAALRESEESFRSVVTRRKQAEADLARVSADSDRRKRLYETILSNTPDLAYVFGLDHRFTYANEGLLKMWGKTWEEAIGKNCLELGYEPWHAEMHSREIDQVVATKKPIRGEVPFTGTFGRRIYDYIFVPVFGADGEVEAVAGTTRDVTDRKVMEDELRDADRRKDNFIALLAHELRNPLAPLRNGLQVLRLAGDDAEALSRARDMMDRQLAHMVRLIDDLLDISRINRNKMELRRERVALSDIVASAVETVRPLIDEARHELSVTLPGGPVYLNADLTRLAQVFSNLLTNSAKYTPQEGKIWITSERAGSGITITVRDTGIGIPAESLACIFDMFSQVDRSIERDTGGLGIGLALVKGLVEMHGGTVKAASDGLGKGSTFTVSLPLLDSRGTSADDPNKANTVQRTSRRILVVDDNKDGADSLAMMLRLLGDDVATANGGFEAVKEAERFSPEVVLMDIGMAGMDGLEATRRIREQPWGKRITIIALTGWGQENDRKRSREAGCDAHLVKPVNLPDLQKLLAEARG